MKSCVSFLSTHVPVLLTGAENPVASPDMSIATIRAIPTEDGVTTAKKILMWEDHLRSDDRSDSSFLTTNAQCQGGVTVTPNRRGPDVLTKKGKGKHKSDGLKASCWAAHPTTRARKAKGNGKDDHSWNHGYDNTCRKGTRWARQSWRRFTSCTNATHRVQGRLHVSSDCEARRIHSRKSRTWSSKSFHVPI